MKRRSFSAKLIALLLAVMLTIGLLPASALADETGDITVYVTVSDRGSLAVGTDEGSTVMGNVPVKVKTTDGKATVDAAPKLCANCCDAALIHEAAIGKIAGEQIIKLRTLGLTEEEAESRIIEGFLN